MSVHLLLGIKGEIFVLIKKCRIIVISLLCILIVFCHSITFANNEEAYNFCELFKQNGRLKLNDNNLYEYCLSGCDKVSIILSRGYETEKVYTSKEDIINILEMLNQYSYMKSQDNRMQFMDIDLTYRTSLKIKLNDKYASQIFVCDSGYIYQPRDENVSSPPFVYAVAYDEKQLCGLINNLYLYDVETVKNMDFCGTGDLYVNDTDMIKEAVYFDKQNVLLPLRSTLETIGATVEWDDRRKCVYVKYGDKSYTCKIDKPDRYNPQREVLNIIDKDNSLSLFVLRGPYINVDDRIYLHSSTFETLVKDWGYTTNIDIENHSVEIKSETQTTEGE